MANESYDSLPRVAKVLDSGKLVLNVGERNAVSVGDKFIIFSLGEEIFDPSTNELLGELEIIKGRGKVDHLQDRLCTIMPLRLEKKVPSKTLGGIVMDYEVEYLYTDFGGAEVGDFAKMY